LHLLVLVYAMASKVIIVTGASRGIGLYAVQSLLRESHRVILTARTEGPLKDLKGDYPSQVAYLAGDLNDFGVGCP
jgi:NAD(P)-dependent dehydrogenase (short-subunit alcohol dehydrogenase family)